MARPKKTGLDYFPFDVDFFSNKKIRILKSRYGTDGIVIYIYLLCEIYKNGYFIIWDDDYKYIISDELNLKDGLIEQVLTFLIKRSLLHSIPFNSDAVLTSPGIQSRFQEAVKSRASKSPVTVIKELWLLTEEKTQSFINVIDFKDFSGNNPGSSGKNPDKSGNNAAKESKAKESKAKESREDRPPALLTVGKYNNVFLTAEQRSKLENDYPGRASAKIDRLSEYMETHGKHYGNHYAMLVKWLCEDTQADSEQQKRKPSYDIAELEMIDSLANQGSAPARSEA